MKNFKLVAVLFLLIGTVNAQTSENPWLVSVGFNAVGLQGDLTGSTPLLKNDYKSMSFGVPSLSVFRSIYGGLSIGAQFSFNSIKKESSGGSDAKFSTIEGVLKYGFARDSKVSPFLKAGFGRTSFGIGNEDEFNAARNATDTYFGGAGLNFKLGDRLSAFVETSFRSTQDAPKGNYSQHTIGLAYGFGAGDTDKDGVSDKKDKCPDVFGLKEFEGCPDTDADGIPDNQDDCPEEAGPEENNGCPDTDGDGVLDKDDACKDVAGLVELGGCPDTDKDGIIDSEDECPKEAGSDQNNGCPWPDQDNDGIADKDDACPEEAGTSEGNGCPEIKNEALNEMNSVGSNILFPANGIKLMGKKTLNAIQEVKRILDENPSASILIEGHASTDGDENSNLNLSLKRAESVKSKLIELGIDESRIEVKAFGETMPVEGQDSIETRSKSRRVVFKSTSN